jgi:transposase-like protein
MEMAIASPQSPDIGNRGKWIGHGAKFNRKKEEAIAALLSQRNVEEAARAVGVGVKTLQRWLKLPEFAAVDREARRAAYAQSIARLQQASAVVVSTLLKVMVDPATPPAVKVRAVDSSLDHALKGSEIEDLEVRLTELERTVSSKNARMRR